MNTREWISEANRNGWKVSPRRGLVLSLYCTKQGCRGQLNLPLDRFGPTPELCGLDHFGQYSADVYALYVKVVAQLVARRRELGLSQEDVGATAGLADGHVNKLEAFYRTAQFQTLQLWAQTLGLHLGMSPSPLPDKTVRAIESKPVQSTDTDPRHLKKIGKPNELTAA